MSLISAWSISLDSTFNRESFRDTRKRDREKSSGKTRLFNSRTRENYTSNWASFRGLEFETWGKLFSFLMVGLSLLPRSGIHYFIIYI